MISPADHLSQWQKIKIKGKLIWITRPSPLTYYTSLEGIIGLEYDILNQFSKKHELTLEVIIADSNQYLFSELSQKKVDIAGANLSRTQNRLKKYLATHYYDQTYTSIISSARKGRIKNLSLLKDLKGGILNNSSYVPIANNLKKKHGAQIEYFDDLSQYELLQKVVLGSLDFTLSDINIVEIFGAYIPKLRTGKKVSKLNQLVFYTSDINDDSLKRQLDKFILAYKSQNKVKKYKELITNTLPNSEPADTFQFLKNYNKRWPAVKKMIYSTAKKYDISPILLGAISYQESHWNPKAISPTLVKGLMMLTKATALEQGVIDRFDTQQSLEGGTQYFLKMKKKVPQRITEPDRTNFALAGYNLGYGNVEKARVLTQRSGKNPDLWSDVKQYLPLLNEMTDIKADGKTAVIYVENIHVYQNLLQWKEQEHKNN